MKYYRVAVAGPTIDGREIISKDIDQMAASYNPQTYGARIWMEHLRGLLPDSIFPAYGDVRAVKAEDWTDPADGKKKRALYAQIEPTPELIKANQSRQKVYFSIEIIKNFAQTGKAYLGGLAVTDSPASIGTEMAAFSLKNREQFTGTLPAEDRLYSFGIQTDQPLTEADTKNKERGEEKPSEEKPSLFAKVKNLLTGQKSADEQRFADITQAVELLAEEVKRVGEQTGQKDQAQAQYQALVEKTTQLEQRYTQLVQTLETNPDHKHTDRPLAHGGDGTIATDC